MTSQRGSHFSQQLMAQRSRSHGILTADHFPLGSRALFLLVSFVASLAEEDLWIRKDMFLRCNETGTGDEWRVMVDPGKPGACHQWLLTIQNENLQNGYYLLDFWSRLFLTKALDCFTKIGFWTAQQSWNRQSWHIGTKGTKGALLAIKTEASFHHGNFDHWSRPVVLAADGPRRFANGLPRFLHFFRSSRFMIHGGESGVFRDDQIKSCISRLPNSLWMAKFPKLHEWWLWKGPKYRLYPKITWGIKNLYPIQTGSIPDPNNYRVF